MFGLFESYKKRKDEIRSRQRIMKQQTIICDYQKLISTYKQHAKEALLTGERDLAGQYACSCVKYKKLKREASAELMGLWYLRERILDNMYDEIKSPYRPPHRPPVFPGKPRLGIMDLSKTELKDLTDRLQGIEPDKNSDCFIEAQRLLYEIVAEITVEQHAECKDAAVIG